MVGYISQKIFFSKKENTLRGIPPFSFLPELLEISLCHLNSFATQMESSHYHFTDHVITRPFSDT